MTRQKSELESLIAQHTATLVSKSDAVDTLVVIKLTNKRLVCIGFRLPGRRRPTLRPGNGAGNPEQGTQTVRGRNFACSAGARERMTQEFKILATDVMKSQRETFGKQNREQIDTILIPLREKLGEFQLGLQTAQTESAKRPLRHSWNRSEISPSTAQR